MASGGAVADVDPQPMVGVALGDGHAVSRVHEEIGCRVGRERSQCGLNWIGWGVRRPALGQECVIRIFDPCRGCACSVEERAVNWVFGKAEARDGDTVLAAVTAAATRCWSPTRRVELEFHECCAGMLVERSDVGVAVGRACADYVRVGVRVTQSHAKPECGMQLEVERSPVLRCRWRVRGQR